MPSAEPSIQDVALGSLCLLAAVVLVGDLSCASFFKPSQANRPNTARAAGFSILGAVVLGAASLLALGAWSVGIGALFLMIRLVAFCTPED